VAVAGAVAAVRAAGTVEFAEAVVATVDPGHFGLGTFFITCDNCGSGILFLNI
jgi:hypothetical protein